MHVPGLDIDVGDTAADLPLKFRPLPMDPCRIFPAGVYAKGILFRVQQNDFTLL